MDLERIQKINNLALDLMKQGLASDRENAIAQAEKIYTGSETEGYSSMRETLEEVKNSNTIEDKPDTSEELSQDEIKNILHQNTTFVVKKFKEFQEKIIDLEREMSSLRTKMTYNRLPTAEQVSNKREEVTVQEAGEAPPVSTQQSNAPNHPRSGAYSDQDVSIEKFFYMGSK